ncbi:MAG: IclR family transcriptional regulator [Desulfobacteraceae bacterium]|nr:MAG: IclR family transcriptional regulator [Desulfobacteraceae bacterium]
MVKSAERAIRILETVAQFSAGLTHSEIAQTLRIPSGSLTPLLTTLSQLGYLSVQSATKRYTLSTGVLSLSRRYQESLDIVRTGEPFLVRLVEMTGEASAITIENGNRSTVVAKVNSRLPLSPSLNLGDSAPLYAGASGRVYLAFRTPEEIDRYLSTVQLKPFTAKTPTDPDLIRKELAAIRAGALSCSREHIFEGVTAIAAPVRDFRGKVVATFIISAPTSRLGPEKEKLVKKALRSVSEDFSEMLGYSCDPGRVRPQTSKVESVNAPGRSGH